VPRGRLPVSNVLTGPIRRIAAGPDAMLSVVLSGVCVSIPSSVPPRAVVPSRAVVQPRRLVDPRALRFVATITSVVLAFVIITGNLWVLATQAVVFAIGAVFGLRYGPYGVLFRLVFARRLGPPSHREDETPPRFAQAVGLAFAVVGVIGYASGLDLLGLTATAFAWVAAFLNAAFGFCLGCETYLLFRRFTSHRKLFSTGKGVTA